MVSEAIGIPVVEIGGSHVTSAIVDDGEVREHSRHHLDPDATADDIFGGIAAAAAALRGSVEGARWGVAIPGPFDYAHGIGDFTGVGKFSALHGVDVRAGLLRALPGAPAKVEFVNDAEAYAMGEWRVHDRPERMICITLGTGVGSGFLCAGRAQLGGPEVPPDGNIHTQTWNGRPLEDFVSSRAIRSAYAEQSGTDQEVRDIAVLARSGDSDARAVLNGAMRVLGEVLAPWTERFGPSLIVIGGSMARSWDVLAGPLQASLAATAAGDPVRLEPATCIDDAPLIGAALHVASAASPADQLSNDFQVPLDSRTGAHS